MVPYGTIAVPYGTIMLSMSLPCCAGCVGYAGCLVWVVLGVMRGVYYVLCVVCRILCVVCCMLCECALCVVCCVL